MTIAGFAVKRPHPLLSECKVNKAPSARKRQEERKTVRKREAEGGIQRGRDGTESHSRGDTVLGITLSVNPINMASLISI